MLWADQILDGIAKRCMWFSVSVAVIFAIVWNIQMTMQVQLIFQYSVSEMLSGGPASWLWAGWWSILLIRRTSNAWVRPEGRFFADNTGGKGDVSTYLDAAAPSGWKFDQDALTICLVSQMYITTVICLFGGGDSICVSHRFWLPSPITKKSWILGILCNLLSSADVFNSKSFIVSAVSNAAPSPANDLLKAWANCHMTTFSGRVSPVVLESLQPIRASPSEKLASTPIPCGRIETMPVATSYR